MSLVLVLVWGIAALAAVSTLLFAIDIGDVACSGGDANNGCAGPAGQPLVAVAGCVLVAVAGWQIFRGYSVAGVSYLATALLAFIIWVATV